MNAGRDSSSYFVRFAADFLESSANRCSTRSRTRAQTRARACTSLFLRVSTPFPARDHPAQGIHAVQRDSCHVFARSIRRNPADSRGGQCVRTGVRRRTRRCQRRRALARRMQPENAVRPRRFFCCQSTRSTDRTRDGLDLGLVSGDLSYEGLPREHRKGHECSVRGRMGGGEGKAVGDAEWLNWLNCVAKALDRTRAG